MQIRTSPGSYPPLGLYTEGQLYGQHNVFPVYRFHGSAVASQRFSVQNTASLLMYYPSMVGLFHFLVVIPLVCLH